MAEIILPPEENEETPQTPELNIDKPTTNSKVITIEFEAKKTNKVSTKDTNQQLYTTDTDAWFEFKETSLEGANGTYSVVFRNRHDGSIFQRTGDVVNGVAYYKIPEQEIRHAGKWRGQLVYTLENGNTTAREFGYDVKGHILDGKDVREIVVEDFETLISQLNSMKDNAELELADLVNAAERNELERQQFYESLVEDINDLQENYQELLDTGVLQTNINEKLEALEEEYAPKLNEVTAQLAQTGEQLLKKPDKTETGWATLNSFDEPTRAVIQGIEPGKINAVLGEGNVTPFNTSFFQTGTNLYNPATTKEGVYYSWSSGNEVPAENFLGSGLIPVEPNEQYFIRTARHIVFANPDGSYVSGVDNSIAKNEYVVTIPSDVRRLRVSWRVDDNPLPQQINKGDKPLPYEPYREYIPAEMLEEQEIEIEQLPIIPVEKLGITNPSTNLFDKSKITVDKYVSNIHGELVDSANFIASDYISVKPDTRYVVKKLRRISYYDENKIHIKGKEDSLPVDSYSFVTPENARFVRFSWYPSSDRTTIHDQQMNLGNVLLPYEEYGGKIKNELLPVIEGVESGTSPKLNIPSKMYALVGQELNIYFDNIMSGRAKDYDFDVTCPIGAQFEGYYRVIPQSTGTFNLKIDIIKDNKEVGVATSELIVSSKQTGSGETRNLLVIGDSTTAGGTTIRKLQENLTDDALTVNTIGTRGTHPYNHEGISGWTARQYVTVSEDHNLPDIKNPFWNHDTESFDFPHYMDKNGLSNLDYVILNLGINDVFSYYSDESLYERIDEFIGQYEEMISSIHNYDSNIKIGISLPIPPAYSQDAFARSYGNGQTRWRYKRNILLLVEELIKKFDNKEGENLHLVPININLDTKHNFPTDFNNPEVPVNARNTDIMVKNYAANAGVHPAQSGYWQTADVYWYWLKSFEI